jgi:hypothetical protein
MHSLVKGGVEEETFIPGGVERETFILGENQFPLLVPPLIRGLGGSDFDFYKRFIKHRIKLP